ncbi:hypothetical protein F0562_002359 [Nyssa sinensis]|uniref:Glutaredoxin domain-containing protein n=1 Tax=Nyssa sinensis TaxID=561372 RepID=A0A5J5C5J9_9ASTE|nr:hypothetical protein F0562_002359 [Nyssa sinensis]
MAGLSLSGGFGSVSLTARSPLRSQSLSPLPTHSIIFNNNIRTFSCSRFAVRGPRKVGLTKIRAMTPSFGSRLEESVKKTVNENPVVVYSKTWCSYSSEVKSLFKRLGYQPLIIELDQLDWHPTVNGRGRRELGHPVPTLCTARNLPTPSPGAVVGLAEHFVEMLAADWQQEEMDVDQAGGEEPPKALRHVEAASALLGLKDQEMEQIMALRLQHPELFPHFASIQQRTVQEL